MEVHLAECRLNGGIPPEISQLSELKYLRLHGNALCGPIPESIGNCRNLEVLRLEESLQVPIGEPGWFVVRAVGSAPLAPVVPGRASALAFTNPIWVGDLIE